MRPAASGSGDRRLATELRTNLLPIETRACMLRMLRGVAGLALLPDAVGIEEQLWVAEHRCTAAYTRQAKRICFNLVMNPRLRREPCVVEMSDEDMAAGTVLERVQTEEDLRIRTFEDMLRERVASMQQDGEGGLLRCNVCGSNDISWQQKQCRGADESMTIFATCLACKHRFKLS
jgi:DNA-directed RNA polymerase subunit M/transcription elongation factor TFIIS